VKVTTAGATVAAGTFTVTTSVLLSKTVGPPTTPITVSGSGFGPNELVDLYTGTTDAARASTSATGTFSYPGFVVPASAQPGQLWISAEGRHSGLGAQAPFVVRADWATFGFKPGGGRRNPYENTLDPSSVGGLGQAWTYPAGSAVESAVAVSSGVAYVARRGGGVAALDATTGAVKWTNSTVDGAIGSGPCVANGVVYAGTDGGTLYALNAQTGAVKWSFATGSAIYSSPVVSNGIVYLGSFTDKVYALNATTGALLWSVAIGASVESSPVVSNGVLYVGAFDDKMYALDATTGSLVWSYATGGTVEGSAAVVNGVVYFGSDDGNFYAVKAANGALLWSAAVGTVYGSPAIANGVVYLGSGSDKVYALNANTGAAIWSVATSGLVGASVAVANGVVYADDYAGQLYALDASYGGVLWTYTAAGDFYFDPPTVVNGTVYVGSDDGWVRAFTLGGGITGDARTPPQLARLRPSGRPRNG
jgi:outer membrane protein assembly factor BamB